MNETNEQLALRGDARGAAGEQASAEGHGRGRGFGRPFAKGMSGNPLGRPRSQTALQAQSVLDQSADDLIQKTVDMGREGNLGALKLCLDRILPRHRAVGLMLELPRVETPADCKDALPAVIDALAAGEITPHEAYTLLSLIEGQRRAIETHEFAGRIKALEEDVKREAARDADNRHNRYVDSWQPVR